MTARPAQAGPGPAPGPARLPGPAVPAALPVPPALLRLGVRQLGRHVLNPLLPWDTQRQRLARVAASALVPPGTAVERCTLGGVPAEVVTAGAGRAAAGPIVVHFHGGGYCVGSPRLARAWAAHLSARAGCRVVLPAYRLAPEHPHPAALTDARQVLNALRGQAGPGSLVLSGDSAGAGLALSLALALREADDPLPAGCMLASPWLDLSADRRAAGELVRRDVLLSPAWLTACALAYAPPGRWGDPAVSPLLAAPAGLPPLLIQSGTDDLLDRDARLLAAAAGAAGVAVTCTRWPGMWHDFALQAGVLAAAGDAVAQAAWFVSAVTG